MMARRGYVSSGLSWGGRRYRLEAVAAQSGLTFLRHHKSNEAQRNWLAIEDDHSVRRLNGECRWQFDGREERNLTLQRWNCATINQHNVRLVGEEYAFDGSLSRH